MNKLLRNSFLAFALVTLSACSLLGVQPQTFVERTYVEIESAKEAVNTVDLLRSVGKLSADDAENQLDNVALAKKGIDISRALHAVDAEAGEARLAQVRIGLRAILDYLAEREASK